jgi:hypothetical protein
LRHRLTVWLLTFSRRPISLLLRSLPNNFTAWKVELLHQGPERRAPSPRSQTGEVSPVIVADFNNDGKPDVFAIEREIYDIGQFVVLAVSPNIFDWVQFRCVGRQVLR